MIPKWSEEHLRRLQDRSLDLQQEFIKFIQGIAPTAESSVLHGDVGNLTSENEQMMGLITCFVYGADTPEKIMLFLIADSDPNCRGAQDMRRRIEHAMSQVPNDPWLRFLAAAVEAGRLSNEFVSTSVPEIKE